jgi:hypothetical protein
VVGTAPVPASRFPFVATVSFTPSICTLPLLAVVPGGGCDSLLALLTSALRSLAPAGESFYRALVGVAAMFFSALSGFTTSLAVLSQPAGLLPEVFLDALMNVVVAVLAAGTELC